MRLLVGLMAFGGAAVVSAVLWKRARQRSGHTDAPGPRCSLCHSTALDIRGDGTCRCRRCGFDTVDVSNPQLKALLGELEQLGRARAQLQLAEKTLMRALRTLPWVAVATVSVPRKTGDDPSNADMYRGSRLTTAAEHVRAAGRLLAELPEPPLAPDELPSLSPDMRLEHGHQLVCQALERVESRMKALRAQAAPGGHGPYRR
jgi:hypothetical protein